LCCLGRCRGVVLRIDAEVSFSRALPTCRSSERRQSFVPDRALHTAEGVARGESRGGYWEGKTPESLNPMDGFGMKQGRKGEGGIRRQEAEKA
jgi:hypothetical protein